MIRELSRMSSMSCTCALALRSMVFEPPVKAAGVEGLSAQDPRPAEDRVERRAELVRSDREELVLGAVRRLGLAPRVFGDREELLSLLQRGLDGLACPHRLGDVEGDDQDAGDLSVEVAVRFVDEADERVVPPTVAASVELDGYRRCRRRARPTRTRD